MQERQVMQRKSNNMYMDLAKWKTNESHLRIYKRYSKYLSLCNKRQRNHTFWGTVRVYVWAWLTNFGDIQVGPSSWLCNPFLSSPSSRTRYLVLKYLIRKQVSTSSWLFEHGSHCFYKSVAKRVQVTSSKLKRRKTFDKLGRNKPQFRKTYGTHGDIN